MNIPHRRFVQQLTIGLVAVLYVYLYSSVTYADECPPGTTQVGTREERINDTTVIVHPQCKRNPRPTQAPTGWQSGLNCAMEDIYQRAETFGPEGRQFAAELRKELAAFRAGAPSSSQTGNDNDVTITDLHLDRQLTVQKNGQQQEGQFIVSVLVARHGTGGVNVDVQSYLTGPGSPKAEENQNIMLFDAAGNIAKDKDQQGATVDMAQISDGVRRCMAR